MKAVLIKEYGSSNVLEYTDSCSEPDVLHSNQVLIKVNASGVIVKCGSSVRNFKVGDAVFCMVDANRKYSLSGFAKGGSYAEYCVTREDTLAIKPDSLNDEEAAALPLCCLTAYQALVYKARIKAAIAY